MISMRLRRLYFLLSYLTGFPRDFCPEMQGFYTFCFQGVPEPVGVIPAISRHPLCFRKTIQQGSGIGIIAYLSRSHKKAQRSPTLVGDRVQLRVYAPLVRPIKRPGSPFLAARSKPCGVPGDTSHQS